jgi:hypothetical protein
MFQSRVVIGVASLTIRWAQASVIARQTAAGRRARKLNAFVCSFIFTGDFF